MRWLTFTAADKTSWGFVEGDQVIAVDGDPFRRMAADLAHASAVAGQNRASADSAHLLLRRPELSEAPEGGRRQAGRSAGSAGQTRDRLSRSECADRT